MFVQFGVEERLASNINLFYYSGIWVWEMAQLLKCFVHMKAIWVLMTRLGIPISHREARWHGLTSMQGKRGQVNSRAFSQATYLKQWAQDLVRDPVPKNIVESNQRRYLITILGVLKSKRESDIGKYLTCIYITHTHTQKNIKT